MNKSVSAIQIKNIIYDKLKELATLDYKDILLWMDRRSWVLPCGDGGTVSLLNSSAERLEEQMNDPENEFLKFLISAYVSAKAEGQVPSSAMNDEQSPAEAPESATKTDNKKAQSNPDQRRKYDDETLTQLVLNLLRESRMDEFTYNQVADEPSIWCDFKAASRVLRRLESRGNDVIEYTVKKASGAKVNVYKFAPERKALDKNYGRAEELVGAAIMEYLVDRGAQSQNAICQAMRDYFGYLDKAVVKEVLEALRAKDRLDENVGPRNARVFCVATKKAETLHFDTHLSGVGGTYRELSGPLVGS